MRPWVRILITTLAYARWAHARQRAGQYVSPAHTHSEDYWAVVISGVMVNKKPDGPDVLLPAGSYYFQKGGETHVTKCTSPDGCVFFVNQSGGFDYHE
jgi:beta-alanine degradation protein BauB